MHACMSLKGKEPRLPTFEAQQSERARQEARPAWRARKRGVAPYGRGSVSDYASVSDRDAADLNSEPRSVRQAPQGASIASSAIRRGNEWICRSENSSHYRRLKLQPRQLVRGVLRWFQPRVN